MDGTGRRPGVLVRPCAWEARLWRCGARRRSRRPARLWPGEQLGVVMGRYGGSASAAWHYAGGAVWRAALPAKLASESRLLLGLRRACYGCAVAVCMRGVELRAAGPGSACLHAAWSACVCLRKRKVSTARCLVCELACRVCAA